MKNRQVAVLCILCTLLIARTVTQAAVTVALREYGTPMLYPSDVSRLYTDSVYIEANNYYLPFNFDTYYQRMATLNTDEMMDETYYFFFDIILHMPKAQSLFQFEKMTEVALRHKDKLMEQEAAFWRTAYLIREPGTSAEKIVESMQPLIDQAAKRKDSHMQLQGISYMLEALWNAEQPDYAMFFNQALSCLDKLPPTEEKSVFARSIFYLTGNAYYHFREYDKAVALLQKALSNYTHYFYDNSNLKALHALANYHATVNQSDSVLYYAKAILDSRDNVKKRPVFDAIAAAHIANVYLKRRQYADAAGLLKTVLKVAVNNGDYAFISQIYTELGKAWLGDGNLEKAMQMADSARYYIQTGHCESQNHLLYTLLKDCYAFAGNAAQAEAYADSIAGENKKQEDTYNTLYILRAEQNVKNATEALQAQREQLIQRLFTALSAFIVIASLGVYSFRIYKKRRRLQANRDQQLKGTFDAIYIADMDPDNEDIMVMDSINDTVVSGQLFRDPSLNTETLASLMGITPQMIVKAVNRIQHKSFARFLIELRIQDAVQTLSNDPYAPISFDQLAIDCGFFDRKSFIRTFRQEVKQSPSEFIKSKKNETAT